MTEAEFDILIYLGIALIIIGLFYKFIFWRRAKKLEKNLPSFLVHLFMWYNVYNMYDSWSYDIKSFMKVNNQSNKLIWLGCLFIITAIFLFKYLKGLVN